VASRSRRAGSPQRLWLERTPARDDALDAPDVANIGQRIQLIDEWISVANKACAEGPESATKRQAEQNEDERERRRRLQGATERYKDL
jgi:hypothetical protein